MGGGVSIAWKISKFSNFAFRPVSRRSLVSTSKMSDVMVKVLFPLALTEIGIDISFAASTICVAVISCPKTTSTRVSVSAWYTR